jgi:hypothetical protein
LGSTAPSKYTSTTGPMTWAIFPFRVDITRV